MYHITLTKDGKNILDMDSECVTALAKSEHGFMATNGGVCDFETAFGLILSLDKLLNMMLDDHPALKLAYALKDELAESTTIDLSNLIRALDTNENEEEE